MLTELRLEAAIAAEALQFAGSGTGDDECPA